MTERQREDPEQTCEAKNKMAGQWSRGWTDAPRTYVVDTNNDVTQL